MDNAAVSTTLSGKKKISAWVHLCTVLKFKV